MQSRPYLLSKILVEAEAQAEDDKEEVSGSLQHEEEVVLRDEVAPLVAENAVDPSDPQPTLIRRIQRRRSIIVIVVSRFWDF